MPIDVPPEDRRAIEVRVVEPRAVPRLGLIFGYAAMLPPLVAAGVVWIADAGTGEVFTRLAIIYGGILLAFFSGVRRGLSFRTMGGPTRAQIATMLGLFTSGGCAILLLPEPPAALAILLAGHAALAVLDPVAARKGEAPLYFARLRPAQMPISVAAYGLLLAHHWIGGG